MIGRFAKQRLAIRAAILAAVLSVWALPAWALVVVSDPMFGGTTIPPIDNPGWNNFTLGGATTANYIYLGNRWALSARHVHGTGAAPGTTLTFSTGTFAMDTSQQFVIHNPTSISTSMGPLKTETDLRLVRLAQDPGLPSIFSTTNPAPFTLPTESPPLSGNVTIIGHGRSREANLTEWNSSWGQVNPPVVPPNPGPVAYSGYRALHPSDDTKRWGTNQLANANSYVGSNSLFFQALTPTAGIQRRTWGDGVERDIISLITSFDTVGGNEAQGVDGDSGSAVFYKRGSQWELVGIINLASTLTGQPSPSAVFGNANIITNLSYYNQPYEGSICDVMKSCGSYSPVAGDVNIDLQLNQADVDDFVAGWMSDNGAGAGDFASWSSGDLNLDGKTNVADFILLRGALNGQFPAAALVTLGLENTAVPEPLAALLVIISMAFLGAIARRRRPSPAR